MQGSRVLEWTRRDCFGRTRNLELAVWPTSSSGEQPLSNSCIHSASRALLSEVKDTGTEAVMPCLDQDVRSSWKHNTICTGHVDHYRVHLYHLYLARCLAHHCLSIARACPPVLGKPLR